MSEWSDGDFVKVTFQNGNSMCGTLKRSPDDFGNDLVINFAPRSGVVIVHEDHETPYSFVSEIKRITTPDTTGERLADITKVREGDIAVFENVRGKVTHIDRDSNDGYRLEISSDWALSEGNQLEDLFVSDDDFLYALRPKLRLPNRPGLWVDKSDNLWSVEDKHGKLFIAPLREGDKWLAGKAAIPVTSDVVKYYSPFRPMEDDQ